MLRDMDLIREILETIERSDAGEPRQEYIAGYSDEQVNFHKHLIIQAMLARGGEMTPVGGVAYPTCYIICLTKAGKEFLSVAREVGTWELAKTRLSETPLEDYATALLDMS